IQDNLSATADPRMARVILENLLGNAWKYTALEPHAKIFFGIWKSNGRTVYQVQDNGVGFDMTYSDRLFGIFQRLHHEDVFPGDGVGLASVQRAVNRHGGQVWAKSDPGQGATFFFSLGDSRE
ncbi:MAG: ATP-binding protein, partial [Thiogranum sp.]